LLVLLPELGQLLKTGLVHRVNSLGFVSACPGAAGGHHRVAPGPPHRAHGAALSRAGRVESRRRGRRGSATTAQAPGATPLRPTATSLRLLATRLRCAAIRRSPCTRRR